MAYTVNQLAKLAGVSVRTLHHYDQIGLLKPSFIKENGYRYYEGGELTRLQQILFFRELDFPLEQIKNIMDAPGFNAYQAMLDQKKLLEMEKERIEKLIRTITSSITKMQQNKKHVDEEIYNGFTRKQMEEYKEEARQRWGNTDAWKQSQERTKHWTKEDYKRLAKEGEEFTRSIVEIMDKGPTSPEAQEKMVQLHQSLQQFYDCPPEFLRNLGQMYVDDKRFTAYYDKFHPRLAVFMRDAMAYFADTHQGEK